MIQCQACGRQAPPDARFCPHCGSALADTGAAVIAADVRDQVMSTLRGEERLVTVVFADMSESVRRTGGLSAEEATDLVNPLLETMVELMMRYGGRIDRFLGDGVLAVFGVPTIHEDDPVRAIRAALALNERASELELEVTVGINTGRVYFGPVGSSLHEELTVMGPTVNLAARLQGAAAPGQVLVGESTFTHARAAFELTPLTVPIKGISDPVIAFRAERLLDQPEKVRGIEGLQAELVGRDSELGGLRRALEAPGRTVALVGPAGVGKTRLASEFHKSVLTTGALWVEGRCLEMTSNIGYAPFIDLLRRHLGTGDPLAQLTLSIERMVADGWMSAERASSVVPFLAHLLGRSMGGDDAKVTDSQPEQRKNLTIAAILDFLFALAGRQEMVVFLEDLHWADSLTINTLARLQQEISNRRLLLVLSYRPREGSADRIAQVLDGAAFVEFELVGLTPRETQILIGKLLAMSGLPDALEDQIVDRAQGNPFYVEELIRSLIQRGIIVRENGCWQPTTTVVEFDLPESVEAVVMARFDRLPQKERTAARVASVLDRSFTQPFFAALAGNDLVTALDELVTAGILSLERTDPVVEYFFVHALTREAIYGNLLPSHRAQLHERIGDTLERLDHRDLDQLAYHFERSRHNQKAVEYLFRAADRSLDSFLTEVPLRYLDGGLDRLPHLPETDQRRWRSLFRARKGELLERMAQHRSARIELEAALAELDSGTLEVARVWRLHGQTHRLEGDFAAAGESYDRAEQALARLPDGDVTAANRAWIEIQKERAFALYFGGRGSELPAHNDKVRPVVAQHGSIPQRVDQALGELLSGFVRDRYVVSPDAVRAARDVAHLARMGADAGRAAEALFVFGFSLLWADQVDKAVETLGEAVEATHRVGAVMEECRARAYQAIAMRRAGLADEAEISARSALELAIHLDDDYYAGHAKAVLCWVDWRRRNPACAETGKAAYKAWGVLKRDDLEGLNSEFSWLAVWPLVAVAANESNYQSAVAHLQYLRTPWERPLPESLARAIEEAIEAPNLDTIERCLALARQHQFL